MEREVNGEDGGLEGGELRAREGAEGVDATYEGLEELCAVESSVAGGERGVSRNRIEGLGVEEVVGRWWKEDTKLLGKRETLTRGHGKVLATR